MHRSFEIAVLKKRGHRTSWISVVLEALYEARRRRAIRDIRCQRRLFRRHRQVALHEQAVGKSRARPDDRQAAASNKFALPLIPVRSGLIVVLALFLVLLLRVVV